MKIITIGSIHGRDSWKEIVKQDFDKVIFIGDYFDSFDIPFKDQLQNFQAIIAFKKQNPDRVVLLIGEHDYQYLRYSKDRHYGYQEVFAYPIGDQLLDAIDNGYIEKCSCYGSLLSTNIETINQSPKGEECTCECHSHNWGNCEKCRDKHEDQVVATY